LAFFGSFAFGLRASLFERFCPLAISTIFNRALFRHPTRQARDASVEGCLHTIQQICPGAPRLSAAFQRRTDMDVGVRRCALTIRRCEGAAPVSRIFGLSP
jgi:hypothetical protein